MKVVNDLVNAGYLHSVRGRGGGIRMARGADAINIGALVRHTEDDLQLVECGSCLIAPACGMTGVLDEALTAFLHVLDRYSLADVLARKGGLSRLFVIPPVSPAPPVPRPTAQE